MLNITGRNKVLMIKLTHITSRFGQVEVFTNKDYSLLYAMPSGYISPALLRKDLAFLAIFDTQSTSPWTYIVNISNVTLVHPLNPFLLKALKKFSNMKAYVIYAPSPIVRLMLPATNWINKPDRVIKDNTTLEMELRKAGM